MNMFAYFERWLDIAHGRSGDKGNHANIAILAYTAEGFSWLRHYLTSVKVAHYFAPLGPSRVVRFEAGGVDASGVIPQPPR